MKKRSFLLIEILIAFSLVAICIVPLVKQPLKLYQEEISRLEQIEKERLADWTFTEVKEMLLKNEIPWDSIPAKGEESASFPLSPAQISIPGCTPKTLHRSFILTGRGEKVGQGNATYRQLGVYIFLEKEKYTFRLPIQKVSI